MPMEIISLTAASIKTYSVYEYSFEVRRCRRRYIDANDNIIIKKKKSSRHRQRSPGTVRSAVINYDSVF